MLPRKTENDADAAGGASSIILTRLHLLLLLLLLLLQRINIAAASLCYGAASSAGIWHSFILLSAVKHWGHKQKQELPRVHISPSKLKSTAQ